ncbi:phage tail spike protein, partial [Saccharococcus caldoxylosilyticus]|uniref:phage tail spike protein n=1 Tax=Saccharococcus caldoxylosilyticus TaxID=81408 RepID=UPI000A65431D
ESYTNPYSYLKQIASEFNLELHFRVETDGNKVTRRYVDLIEHVGGWNGREVEFGKDLIGIERKEDFSNIVTALVGIGPERDDGTRLQVFVEDKDALARWGRNGKHLVDVYEPDSSDSNMTLEQLRSLTEAELAKRINSSVEYTGDVVDLEKVPGLEHEKFRLGDTIRIKDTAFTPPLYLEARIHTVERSIKQNGQKTVTLGDYIEYTEEDVFAIYKRLQAEIAKKVSLSKVMEVTYTKEEIDTKDTNVKIEAAQDATNKAQQAEESAKQYTETYAEKKIYRGLASPLNPVEGEFWLDENTNPPIWRKWDGQNWVKITRESFEDLKGVLKSHQIEDGAITAAKIALDAIRNEHIADFAITDVKIAAGAITEEKMKWQTHLIF